MAVEAWYSETKFFSYPGDDSYDTCDGGDKFSEYGHLTQMMWQKSGELGCAEYVCPDSGWAIFTCNYSPAGNTQGEKMFPESNFKKLCEAEPGVWTTCKENLVTEGCKMGRGQMTDENELLMALLVACGITLGKSSYASYDVN
ncbi:uncharacterized protein LOC134854977 [Symsagittifera roscoffensis]|uniref:uncharacterized protein LOC134854977 n=1 Tax=Symsagittifera roscoffensis TaxID=84072 RepID=UPI00307C15CA